MRLSSILCLFALVSLPSAIKAQPNPNQNAAAGAGAPSAGASAPAPEQTPSAQPEAAPGPASEPEAPAATEPAGAGSDATEPSNAAPSTVAGNTETAAPELAIPSPGELGDRLAGDLPPPEEKKGWAAPSPIVTLHGYLRARGELMDHFWLGRGIIMNRPEPDPFSRFRPLERTNTTTMCGGSAVTSEGDIGNVCKVKTLQFANMRFRLSPQLNISEDIRIKSTFDILDNYVLGTGPVSYYGAGPVSTAVFPGTNIPTGTLILPRRVWAEVRNRDLGELRFGLMPDHWGLGMVANAGNGLDDDYSTDVGRVMATTKLLGFYLSAAYDFVNEGRVNYPADRPGYDASQIEDFDQYTFSVVRRFPDEDEETVLARGDAVLNGGARFQLASQDSLLASPTELRDLNATIYTPDVWAQLKIGKLRLEIEAAWVVGSLLSSHGNRTKQYVSQLGAAFESELRLINDKLGLFLYAGAATGDSEVEGLSSDANFIDQAGLRASGTADSTLNNNRVSTFRFHPAYRVDLILWRNIMRQITGAMYVKPGISYDFVKDSFGQLFGARVDLVYSRATSPIQTWGNDPNLGVEIDAQVYWRSADGPNLNDGYHAFLQYGVLFPMRGLAYVNSGAGLTNAQTLRLVLGTVF